MTNSTPEISIIIPALNEENHIASCINHLKSTPVLTKEIIVVDGGSKDNTIKIARQNGAKVLSSDVASRAAQMNLGAQASGGKILYFVHADTKPPVTYAEDILNAYNKGYSIGGYRQRFDKDSLQLKYNAFFSRFNFLFCRGGDQSLFIEKKLFESLGGYNTRYVVMEEYDLMRRARKINKFCLMPKATLVSSRKYFNNSFFKVNCANAQAMLMFYCNKDPQKIKAMYNRVLKQH